MVPKREERLVINVYKRSLEKKKDRKLSGNQRVDSSGTDSPSILSPEGGEKLRG